MTVNRIARIALFASLTVLLSAFLASSGGHPAAKAQPHHDLSGGRCIHVGGAIITNFGAVDPNTTLGPATGDLRGAVAASLLAPPQPGPNGTVLFQVQHHWVTEAGDNIYFDPAVATTIPLSQTRFAFTSYPVHISGGTGKFAGATGDLINIGEADLQLGTAIRYSFYSSAQYFLLFFFARILWKTWNISGKVVLFYQIKTDVLIGNIFYQTFGDNASRERT